MTVLDDVRVHVLAAGAALALAMLALPDWVVYVAGLWILREVFFRPTVTERT
jgi:hypothetical protein